jgi:hypothetical protein
MKWTKTTGNHALSGSYGYFIQYNRRLNWRRENPDIRQTINSLTKVFGDSTTLKDVENPETSMFKYQWIRNAHWFLDINRHRIYIRDEKTITLLALHVPNKDCRST